MTPEELIKTLNNSGFRLWVEGDKVKFSPVPSPALVEQIRTNKAEIVSILHHREIFLVFSTAVSLITTLDEGSPEYEALVEAFDKAPEDDYPFDLARIVVNVFRRIDRSVKRAA